MARKSTTLIAALALVGCAGAPLDEAMLHRSGWVKLERCETFCDGDGDRLIVCGTTTGKVVGRCARGIGAAIY